MSTTRRRPVASLVAEAEDPGTTTARLAELARHPSATVRQAVAESAAIDDGTLLLLAHDAFREVRVRTAETTSYRDLFDLLLRDADPHVRGACADNPRATRDDVDRLLHDRSAHVRAVTADGALNLPYPDREQTRRAARDRSVHVRSGALDRGVAWPEVARLLADDPDELVRRRAREIVAGGPDVVARVERYRRAEALRQLPSALEV